jgi:hypothetical protein
MDDGTARLSAAIAWSILSTTAFLYFLSGGISEALFFSFLPVTMAYTHWRDVRRHWESERKAVRDRDRGQPELDANSPLSSSED